MKSRRPERFSDSVTVQERALDRVQLEYILDTITSRSEEVRFANFAKRVAEATICPNLLPQTGPTGGGDSKVDSETVPVADPLALLWGGLARDAASERWAFAFSAKADWREKAKSDFRKIAETGRGYAKAFFITNQFVRDKARGELEDELRPLLGLDVRVLDRTWLLDQVFQHRLEPVAVSELGLPTAYTPKTLHGPLDSQRARDFEELTLSIQRSVEQGQFTPELVEDALEAALLARGMERPRSEVEGLLARASDLADRCGLPMQRCRISYAKAWTAFFWHEDRQLTNHHYEVVEKIALERGGIAELELLCNLWMITGIAAEGTPSEETRQAHRAAALLKVLAETEADVSRPSSSLQAETFRLQIEFRQLGRTGVNDYLKSLSSVIDRAEPLPGFPLAPILEIVEELGDFVGELPEYAHLFEKTLDVRMRRTGDVEAGSLLLSRGRQQLKARNGQGAVKSLGRAMRLLHKDETREDEILALAMCSAAYEGVGLLWAARGTLLAATSLAMHDFEVFGRVNRRQLACLDQLRWLELRLGRLPHSLLWHGLFVRLESMLAYEIENEADMYDAVLGIALMKCGLDDLRHLERLPGALQARSLFGSAAATLFSLGHEDAARELLRVPHDNDMSAMMVAWRDQPVQAELPPRLELGRGQKITLASNVCGARLLAEVQNQPACLVVAESMLSALEAFLATGLEDGLIAREPELNIRVRSSDFQDRLFSSQITSVDGRPMLELTCSSFDLSAMTPARQLEFQEAIFDVVLRSVSSMFIDGSGGKSIESMIGADLALDRAVSFAGNPMFLLKLTGGKPKMPIDDLLEEQQSSHPLTRTEPWDAAIPRASAKTEPEVDRLRTPTKHTDVSVTSVIRLSLWDQARWIATGYAVDMSTRLPTMLLVFRDDNAAARIFSLWHDELSVQPPKIGIRVSVVRGVDADRPHAYRIMIGSDLSGRQMKMGQQLVDVFRVHSMDATSPAHLDNFLTLFRSSGEFLLGAASMRPGDAEPRDVAAPTLRLKTLFVRDAWEIAPGEWESACILAEDSPVRPPDTVTAPIDALLAQIRERRAGTFGQVDASTPTVDGAGRGSRGRK